MKASKLILFLLISGFLFFSYGFFCRILSIYFFWESKSFGWFLLLLAIILLLLNRIKLKTIEKKKSLVEKIGLGIISFIILVQMVLFIVIPFTDAYNVSVEALENDKELKSKIGNIIGITHKPNGTISKQSGPTGVQGEAVINLIVKGEKKYLDVAVYSSKSVNDNTWIIDKIEY